MSCLKIRVEDGGITMKDLKNTFEKAIHGDLNALGALTDAILSEKLTNEEKRSLQRLLIPTTDDTKNCGFCVAFLAGLVIDVICGNHALAIDAYSIAIRESEIKKFFKDMQRRVSDQEILEALQNLTKEILDQFDEKLVLLMRYMIYRIGFLHEKITLNYNFARKFYQQSINTFQEPTAMFRLANMHLNGHGGPINKLQAIILYRAVQTNFANIKSIKETLTGGKFRIVALEVDGINEGEIIAIQYHRALILAGRFLIDFMQCYPKEMLRLLAQDDLLGEEEKFSYLATTIKYHPNISPAKGDQAGSDLLGKYCLHKADSIIESSEKNINAAIMWYWKVPANSNSRGAACYSIGIHQYHHLHNSGLSNKAAFYCVQDILYEGVKLKDEGCIEFYEHSVQLVFAQENASETYEDENPAGKIKKIENLRQKFLSLSEKEKQDIVYEKKLYDFINKHRLNDLNYWHQQVTAGGKLVQNIRVPHGIAMMYEIIHSEKSAVEKCDDLVRVQNNRAKTCFLKRLFARKSATQNCYDEVPALKSSLNHEKHSFNLNFVRK